MDGNAHEGHGALFNNETRSVWAATPVPPRVFHEWRQVCERKWTMRRKREKCKCVELPAVRLSRTVTGRAATWNGIPRLGLEPGACVTLEAMKRFLICLVLAGLAWSACAQTMWRDAPMQASPAEIRALMPDARETSPGQRAVDPGALLEIPGTPIADEDFTATFHFESERLQRIHLRAQPASRERAQALLQTLQSSLRARYGLPISTKTRQGAALGSVDLMWSFRRMTVQLQMLDGKTVELIYKANLPSQPGGL
jgi:hypothetical protein